MASGQETLLCQNCGSFNKEDASWCRTCGQELSPSSIRILPVGTVLDHGRYTISGYIGHGGSAITYRARQRNFTAEIALREYYPSMLVRRDISTQEVGPADPEAELPFDQGKAQFLNEGDNLRTLGKVPNLVQVHDVFEDKGTVYMVEDLVRGESLSDLLARRRKLSFAEAMALMEPVMKVLIQVHGHGLIHRDIKPSNIMISDGTPYLIDFGISKRIVRNTTISAFSGSRQEITQSAFTRGYAAPEQITGEAREAAWTDVYGAAATLYRMVTGMDPDDAEARLVRDMLPSPFQLGAAVTEEESDAIMTGLAMDTLVRFQTMQAFLTALTAGEREEAAAVAAAAPVAKRKTPMWIACGVLLLLVIFGFWKWGGRLPFPQSGNSGSQEEGEIVTENPSGDKTDASSREETPQEGKAEEEESVPAEPAPVTIQMNVRLLDDQKEALSGYHVRIYQILTENGQSGTPRLLASGQTDSFGWLPTIEAEQADGFIRFELQESGNVREVSMKDLEAGGGQAELSFPFHFYPETYTYGGHTYAAGNLHDAAGLSSYDDVEAYCERLGGHLAVINNGGEDAFLFSSFCTPGVSTAFFGYTDQDSEGNWKWAFGSSDYTNWTRPGGVHPGPDNGNGYSGWGPENYAEYNCGDNGANDGSWNDAKFAVNTSAFIIEWEFERP